MCFGGFNGFKICLYHVCFKLFQPLTLVRAERQNINITNKIKSRYIACEERDGLYPTGFLPGEKGDGEPLQPPERLWGLHG